MTKVCLNQKVAHNCWLTLVRSNFRDFNYANHTTYEGIQRRLNLGLYIFTVSIIILSYSKYTKRQEMIYLTLSKLYLSMCLKNNDKDFLSQGQGPRTGVARTRTRTKDWSRKDKDKDKDLSRKDKDKDKDLIFQKSQGQGQGQGLESQGQGQGQGLESQGQGQGQGLEKLSLRTDQGQGPRTRTTSLPNRVILTKFGQSSLKISS